MNAAMMSKAIPTMKNKRFNRALESKQGLAFAYTFIEKRGHKSCMGSYIGGHIGNCICDI